MGEALEFPEIPEIPENPERRGAELGLTGGEGIWQGVEAAEDASAGRRWEETERA